MAQAELDTGVAGQVMGDEDESTILPSSMQSFGGGSSGTDNNDIRLPWLQIAYGVGKLATTFTPGDLVLGGDTLMAKKQEPLNVIILGTVKYYKEYLSGEQYAARVQPRLFKTEEEVRAAGGRLDWGPKGSNIKPDFAPALAVTMLVRKPEGMVSGLFGLELPDGFVYAPAMFNADKGTFKRIAPYITLCERFSLRKKGLLSGVFELKTTIETNAKSGRVGPQLNIRVSGYNTDETIVMLCGLFNIPVPAGVSQQLAAPPAAIQLPESAG
jgi:hypothetical protein